LYLARAYKALENENDAILNLKKALELNPENNEKWPGESQQQKAKTLHFYITLSISCANIMTSR